MLHLSSSSKHFVKLEMNQLPVSYAVSMTSLHNYFQYELNNSAMTHSHHQIVFPNKELLVLIYTSAVEESSLTTDSFMLQLSQ